MTLVIDFQTHRPQPYIGRGDSYLSGMIKDLRRFLADLQNELSYDTLHLSLPQLTTLAHILVEFAEDLHNDIGIWRALEQYNQEFFGTPLPLTRWLGDDSDNEAPDLTERLHHLLWIVYSQINPDLILGPHHMDLRYQAIAIANFFDKNMTTIPRQSGIKRFLAQPNKFGWDVKRKLIWLGQHSYLFRYQCHNYVAANGGQPDIATINNFICQQTTCWSGLGVIDILAAVLPLTKKQRSTLRTWYEPHAAYYQIKTAKTSLFKVINLVNHKFYKVRVDKKYSHRFKPGNVVAGSLVLWNGTWYWSGEQQIYESLPEDIKQTIPQEMLQQSPQLVYSYDKTLAAQAEESLKRLHHNFTTYHGNTLAVYPDGISMAGDMQKMYRLYNEAKPETGKLEVMKKYNLSSVTPQMPYPPELVESDDGVAVFFNPVEGPEIFNHFDVLTTALKKEGQDLSDNELSAIQGLIESPVLSPSFVQRLVQDYGDSSIAAVYIIQEPSDYYLEYLLRRHKGPFYRNRYPNIKLMK